MTDPPATTLVSEYELKIDAQVEKFLETKHKLVYFLVTASAAPILAVVQFLSGKSHSWWISIAAAGGTILGLCAAGAALWALWCEVASYRKHIAYRYARKSWDELTPQQHSAWTALNRRVAWCTKVAFVVLCLEFVLFASVGIGVIATPPDRARGVSLQLTVP